MAEAYRYLRPPEQLEYYHTPHHPEGPVPPETNIEEMHDYFPVRVDDELALETGVEDIRRYLVLSPTGDQLGTIEGFLADAAQGTLTYTYVTLSDRRVAVLPTDQLTILAGACRTTLEGGLEALHGAPTATFTPEDATVAEHYWRKYRLDNAA